ncbi:hypothetical protein JXL19_05715 [bacterium]|nr:hypothetical protein [bacterium]
MFNLIIKSISDLFFIIIFLTISLGLGRRIWSIWFDNPDTPVDIIEEGIFCVSLGLGFWGLIILIIGLLGFLNFWNVLSISVLAFLYSFRGAKAYCLNIYRNKNKFIQSSIFPSRVFLVFSPFLIFATVWLFLTSRVPPVFYDALVYHLGVPNQYIIRNAIEFFPYSIHSHHPFLIQNIFLICLLMGGHGTVKLLVFVFAIFNALLLSLFAGRFSNRPLSWLAGPVFLLTPTMLIMGSLVNVDLGFSLYALLALYSLCRMAQKKEANPQHEGYITVNKHLNDTDGHKNDIDINADLSSRPDHIFRLPGKKGSEIQQKRPFLKGDENHLFCHSGESRDPGFSGETHMNPRFTKGNKNSQREFSTEMKWLIIAAAMAGLSLGTKYTAAVFSFGLCLLCLMAILIKERRDLKYITKSVMLFAAIALLLGSCWYIKNYIWTGNPVYPKWADVWGNPKIPKEKLDASDASAHAYDPGNPARSGILSIPVDIVFNPDWFGAGGNIGPLFLFLLPLALIGDIKNRLYPLLMPYCALYFIAWAYTFRMARFALPLFAVIIMLATGTLGSIFSGKRVWPRYLIYMILIAGFSYNIYYSVSLFSHLYNPWKYLKGKETEYSYLSRNIPGYPVFEYINNNLPLDSTILFLGETVSFYCLRRVIASTAFDINPVVPVLKRAEKPDDVHKGLKEMKVTHLLVNLYGIERLERSYNTYQFTEKDRRLIGDFLRTSRILFRRGDILLIEI